jgi:putative ATPase
MPYFLDVKYILYTLEKKELEQILKSALQKDNQLKNKEIKIVESEALIELSGGDARKLLSLLELVIQNQKSKNIKITNALVFNTMQTNTVLFDKNGDFHYDIVSAFIKSIRGSDPNAAVYWLARMIEAGEDIAFIARRMLILAAEDVGIANPTALVLANSTFQAVTAVGYPEGRILLSECAIYLASSPKSNKAYKAIDLALEKVKQTGNLQVPVHLRNAPTKLMKDLGYGKGYQYAHDFKNQFAEQEFLPEEISGTKFYDPGENPKEYSIRNFLKTRWKNKYNY